MSYLLPDFIIVSCVFLMVVYSYDPFYGLSTFVPTPLLSSYIGLLFFVELLGICIIGKSSACPSCRSLHTCVIVCSCDVIVCLGDVIVCLGDVIVCLGDVMIGDHV